MNPTTGQNERSALKLQLAFQRQLIFGLIGANFVLAGGWGWTVMNATTAIVPTEVRRPYELGANYASKDYLADMADYVLSKVLNASPALVDYNNQAILKMADPDGWGKLKVDLDAAAMRLKKDRISTVWVPGKYQVFEKSNKVTYSGRLKTYIADVLTSERDKEYTVEFNISSGRLYVLKLNEVVKPEPAAKPAQ